MGHASNPIFILADLGGGIEFLFHLFGMYEFLPENSIIEWIGHFFCDVSEHPILGQLCDNIAFIIAGVDEAQLNTYAYTLPPKSLHTPISVYAIKHA